MTTRIGKMVRRKAVATAILLGFLSPSVACADIQEGLVASYEFDGDVRDSSGNGNHGNASDIRFVKGVSGEAISLDGSLSSYVEIPHSSDFHLDNGLTLSLWVKVLRYAEPYLMVVYKAGRWPVPSDLSFSDRIYSLWLTAGKGLHLTSTPKGGSEQATCDTSNNLYGSGRFFHIAAVIDARRRNMELFVDGSPVKSCRYPKEIIRDGNKPLRIGGLGRYPRSFKTLYDQAGLVGSVDELRIYNRALSREDVRSLADAP